MKPNQTTPEITVLSIDHIPAQGKELLKTQDHTKGLITRVTNEDGFNRHTLLYEQDKFVIIVPNGEKENALLYGDWDAALHASKQILVGESPLQQNLTVSIASYLQ